MEGRTIALYGDSDSGKTTQFGELAKYHFKKDGRKSILHTADKGGYESIKPLVRLGLIDIDEPGEGDDPWIWLNHAASDPIDSSVYALVGYDSATSISEMLLDYCANSKVNIGTAKSQRFTVSSGSEHLVVGSTNEGHYLVVQNFMLNKIFKSTWYRKQGVDVLWTFSTLRGESSDRVEIVGPMMGAGKALTPKLPKWFEYTFRLVVIAELDKPARHVLYLQPQPDMSGTISFGNSRYPLDAITELPASIEPASLVTAFELIQQGQDEAEQRLKEELGM